ncbi:hypothetical protein PR048_014423 [Dryococelus australis]|uniref:Uncharacterized protein n=1 Tax=Dryococelus australis TaxID=614101 RepID=A0ABQ9HE69_9NEOP|nr:hypothetical protein PR048_014423 [Dryococelus australis]
MQLGASAAAATTTGAPDNTRHVCPRTAFTCKTAILSQDIITQAEYRLAGCHCLTRAVQISACSTACTLKKFIKNVPHQCTLACEKSWDTGRPSSSLARCSNSCRCIDPTSGRNTCGEMFIHAVWIATHSSFIFVGAGSCVPVDLPTTSHKWALGFMSGHRSRGTLQNAPLTNSQQRSPDDRVHHPAGISHRCEGTSPSVNKYRNSGTPAPGVKEKRNVAAEFLSKALLSNCDWLDYSSHTSADWVRPPTGQLPDFPHVGIVPDDAAGRRVFSGISRFPRPFIPHRSQDLDVTGAACLSLELRCKSVRKRYDSGQSGRHFLSRQKQPAAKPIPPRKRSNERWRQEHAKQLRTRDESSRALYWAQPEPTFSIQIRFSKRLSLRFERKTNLVSPHVVPRMDVLEMFLAVVRVRWLCINTRWLFNFPKPL